MLDVKNTITELKNATDGLISRLDTAQERISEPEDKVTETSKTKMQRENRISKNQDTSEWCIVHVTGILKKEERKELKKYFM